MTTETLEQILSKARKDENFKKALVNDPLSTIENYLSKPISIPEGLNIKVFDQTDPKTIYLNITTDIDLADIELTDNQLEIIAGGTITYGTGSHLLGD